MTDTSSATNDNGDDFDYDASADICHGIAWDVVIPLIDKFEDINSEIVPGHLHHSMFITLIHTLTAMGWGADELIKEVGYWAEEAKKA